MKSIYARAALLWMLVASCELQAAESRAVEQQAAAPLHWYRCNTHTHTTLRPNSDTNGTAEFVAQWYKSHGYQCVVITDHEFLTDVAPLNREFGGDGKFLVLRGQEITQVLADPAHPGGARHFHVNGIGTDTVIMPVGYPQPASGISPVATYQKNFAAIRAAGGIAQVNHPNLQWSVQLDDLLPLASPYLLEVWNSFPTSNNLGGIDESGNLGKSTEALWDGLLSKGRVVWGVASDDAHEYQRFDDRETPTPGKGWIVLQAASLTVPAIMEALRTGRFYASTGISLESYAVDSNSVAIRIAPAREWAPALKNATRYVTRFIGADGRLLAEVNGVSPRYSFKGDEKYVRASIVDSDGRRAWTQPVFR